MVFISSRIRREQLQRGEELFPEEEAYQEALAQYERFIELVGRKPDYIDLHVLEVEPLINAVVRAMKTCDISTSPYADTNLIEPLKQSQEQYTFYKNNKEDVYRYITNGNFTFNNEVEVLICHPGFLDYQVVKTSTMLEERLFDYALVTSPDVHEYLKKHNIKLVNFNNYKEV
ncbi:MAG: ChbG/HpnK family deacetylase [Coprobacillaceae bacterium]